MRVMRSNVMRVARVISVSVLGGFDKGRKGEGTWRFDFATDSLRWLGGPGDDEDGTDDADDDAYAYAYNDDDDDDDYDDDAYAYAYDDDDAYDDVYDDDGA